jgi:hypothetical protein
MSKKLGFLILLTILTIFGLGLKCKEDQVASNPCDDYKSNRMRVELDWQEGYYPHNHGLQDVTAAGSFSEAGTELAFCRDTSFTSADTTYFDAYGLFNEDRRDRFFEAHKNMDWSLEYYLATFKGSQQNKTRYPKFWGFTIAPSSPNSPPSPKWSYVFVGDITSEPDYGKNRTLTYAVIHELGHQRTGLTHPEEHPEYHFPEPNDDCIMHSSVGLSETVLTNMGFCAHDDATPDNCRYFLKQRNQ